MQGFIDTPDFWVVDFYTAWKYLSRDPHQRVLVISEFVVAHIVVEMS
jgi:hypothetical protein